MRKLVLSLVLALFTILPLHAAQTELKVNLVEKTLSPAQPTVNLRAGDTIVVRLEGDVQQGGTKLPDDKMAHSFDIPTYSASHPDETDVSWNAAGRFVTVSFRDCSDRILQRDLPNSLKKRLNVDSCPFAVLSEGGGASWTIFSNRRTLAMNIYTYNPVPAERMASTPGTEVDGKIVERIGIFSFAIQLDEEPFGLAWSAGFSVLGTEDRRYRLQALTNDTQNAQLIRVKDANPSYKLAAFAHYLPSFTDGRAGFSAGLATDVPVEDLTVMGGLSFALRTLPVDNTWYITLGAAYTKEDRLRSEFEGRSTVPASLTKDALLEKRYGLAYFVSFSFGFFGGEQQFKGVYSGGGKKGGG